MAYLRVLSPKTRNGNDLVIGEDGRVEYKETHLPMSSKRYMELQNAKLPDHLKKKIEVVYDEEREEVVKPQNQKEVPIDDKKKKRPGPQPKAHEV